MKPTRRTNPIKGSHPDLFVDANLMSSSLLPSPARNLFNDPIMMIRIRQGDTPLFVPVADLDPDELAQMPRVAFTNEEWDELDEHIQDEINANDPDVDERISAFTQLFVDRWTWENDGSHKDFSYIEESFEYWLTQKGDDRWTMIPDDDWSEFEKKAGELGIGEEQLQAIANEVLSDTNHYSFNQTPRGRPHAPVFSEEIEGNLYIEQSDFIDELSACTPDEIERAIKRIYKATNGDIDLEAKELTKKNATIERTWMTGEDFHVRPQWDSIGNSINEALDEADVPDDVNKPGTPPPEERVVYRWPDGFYVQDLVPSELALEGKTMGMCVGRPDMGYGKAVRDGEIKILSIRRPSGKPLFTIEASLARGKALRGRKDDDIDSIDQIKGKANRKPGFDLGKAGMLFATGMKKDEVERVFEFVELGTPVTVDDVDDLRPSRDVVKFMYANGDAWATKLVSKVGLDKMWDPPSALKKDADREAKIIAEYEVDRATLAGNPAKVCGVHGAKCGGFCAPYKRRRR